MKPRPAPARSAPTGRTPAVDRLVGRDRWVVLGGLAIIVALAWAFVLDGAGTGMSTLAMTSWSFPPPLRPSVAIGWDAGYWLVMVAMWWVMMIAMMLPSAAPVLLLYARIHRGTQTRNPTASPSSTAFFAAGYLAVWLGFSLTATAGQWGLEQAGLVHAMMMWSLSPALTGGFLIAAGLYQLTPLKRICLDQCRSPLGFLLHHWRDGRFGGFRMGLRHGAFCVGCCWVLMGLLFVGGIMNLVWIAGLALVVLLEKAAPLGVMTARLFGLALTAAGVWVLVTAWL